MQKDLKPVLENEFVRLEPLELHHAVSLAPVAFNPVLWQVGATCIANYEDLENYIKKAITERELGNVIPFAIYDKRNQRFAGSTRFAELNLVHKRVEIGWTWIDLEFQGTGLNKAMKFEMLNYAFETLHLNRVEIKTDELNLQSQNAIKSIGATFEGTFRNHAITWTGRVRNTVYFSILKEEWPEIKSTIFSKYSRIVKEL